MQTALRLSYLTICLAALLFFYKRFWTVEAAPVEVQAEVIEPPAPPPPPEPTEEWESYTVKKGDTLGVILSKYGVSTNKFLKQHRVKKRLTL